MFGSLGLCASLIAATGQAILLPPNISPESLQMDDVMGFSVVDPLTQLTQVPCVSCPFAEAKGSAIRWVEGVENSLFLNISVGAQPETLELNGFRFYPPLVGVMLTPPTPAIPQVPADVSLSEIRQDPARYLSNPLRVSGWSFQTESSHTASDTGDEVLEMKIHISSLEGQSVSVPDVLVTALKMPDAKLMILNVEAADVSTIPSTPEEQKEQECQNWPLLCQWKEILAAKLQGVKESFGKLKGCTKRPGGMMLHRPATNLHHGPNSHHDGAGMRHHKKPHHHHMHHHKHHGVYKFLHNAGRVTLSILVPILVGITVGVMTYMVGMLLGCTAAFIWNAFRGSRRGQYAPVSLDEEEGSRDTEKEVYIQEPAEEFEAPPVYEEAVEKEVVQH